MTVMALGKGAMKVLHVISSIDPRSGGPPVALIGLAEAQRAIGLEVFVVATWTKGADLTAADRLRQQGIRVNLVGPCLRPLVWHRRIGPVVREETTRAEVVHVHGVWEEVQHRACRVAQSLGKPYIIRPCGMLDPWGLRQRALKKKIYLYWRLRRNLNRAAALHFTAPAEHALTEPLRLVPAAIVEPNGVDLTEFAELPVRGTFRSRYPQPDGRLLVLFLSRLHHKKGLELLIPAFAQTAASDAFLVLAGPDSDGYQAKLAELARRHGLADRVIFTGMLHGKERIAALADADLFVLPSYQENFGLAVVEALASQTPVLISDQVNIHEDIRSAGVGGVVPAEVAPLAAELKRWLADTELRMAAASRARAFVQERYDWRPIAHRWAGHYERLVGGHQPGPGPFP
jgi:glycosyltransferase involved in cell wall biosynthesis